jgi:hypothetical protein
MALEDFAEGREEGCDGCGRKRDAQQLLQFLDGLAGRRLADVERLGGGDHALQARHSRKQAI